MRITINLNDIEQLIEGSNHGIIILIYGILINNILFPVFASAFASAFNFHPFSSFS